MTALIQVGASQSRFARTSRMYRLKLFCFSREWSYDRMLAEAKRLGISSPRFALAEVEQTVQVLRDLGVSLPGRSAS